MVQSYLGLGSNIGDREQQLQDAIKIIDSIEGISVTKISQYMKLHQWGILSSPIFKFVFRN